MEKEKKGRRLVSFFDTFFLVLLIYALGVFFEGLGGREMGKRDPFLFFAHSFSSRGKKKEKRKKNTYI